MAIIQQLKDEHVELRRIADELGSLVSPATPCDPGALARCRWKLARLVTRHLALEDRQIYSAPHDPGSPLAAVATSLKDELGGLYAAFHQHITTWSGDAVAADWPMFRAETRTLLEALHARINREERELYPLVEASAPRETPKAA